MQVMDKLRFGTAGIPLSTPIRNTLNGIAHVRRINLEAMELEFVRQVNLSEEVAPLVKKAAREHDVALTCHGQYFINLNSSPETILASKKRIYDAARIASLCGAGSITFHAAYYMNANAEVVYQKVKAALTEIISALQAEGHSIWIRPETTGKATQWGHLKEILRLSQELEQVLPTIDFSHLHARSGGKNNTLEEFRQMLLDVERALGRTALDNMHIHVSGIEYTDKGERNHLNLLESDLNYSDLIRAWKEFNIKGVVISESPNIEGDALLMKEEYEKS
ncbi:TIM barrel protein [Candidatus Woesearchaeota archaeon]|nr:TIM barrel protein [Candidatus Woesearchaeota archaeon]